MKKLLNRKSDKKEVLFELKKGIMCMQLWQKNNEMVAKRCIFIYLLVKKKHPLCYEPITRENGPKNPKITQTKY